MQFVLPSLPLITPRISFPAQPPYDATQPCDITASGSDEDETVEGAHWIEGEDCWPGRDPEEDEPEVYRGAETDDGDDDVVLSIVGYHRLDEDGKITRPIEPSMPGGYSLMTELSWGQYFGFQVYLITAFGPNELTPAYRNSSIALSSHMPTFRSHTSCKMTQLSGSWLTRYI